MNLFTAYELLRFICNKDFAGNIITPERFKLLIKVVNIDLYRKKYGLPEGYSPGSPVPVEHIDITIKNTDDMKAFKMDLSNTPVTGGVLPYPSDYAHRDTVVYRYSKTINKVATELPRPVEILRDAQAAERRGNYTKRPTVKDPIGVMRQDGIYIYPKTITSVDFYYWRWPREPSFVYVTEDGYITYDALSSVEFEWPEDEHNTLNSMMLTYIGVNLRENEIVQYSGLKQKQG